ncbi:hypothetical protein, partial [Burkholderia multivorans]
MAGFVLFSARAGAGAGTFVGLAVLFGFVAFSTCGAVALRMAGTGVSAPAACFARVAARAAFDGPLVSADSSTAA